MAAPRLTRPLVEAIIEALNAALAGGGFDGGDFAESNPEHFERALRWAEHKRSRYDAPRR